MPKFIYFSIYFVIFVMNIYSKNVTVTMLFKGGRLPSTPVSIDKTILIQL